MALGRRRVGTTVFETLRFDSGWAPHAGEPGGERWQTYERNHRVRVLLLRHRSGPRPWVVCVHGAEMGGRPLIDTQILRADHLHRSLGLNVAVPVLPGHGPRRPASGTGSAASFPGLDLLDNIHGLAQSAWDVRRLLRWIESQHPTGVALTGFSLGGYVSALVAGLDAPLDAVVAGCPAVDFPQLFRRNTPSDLRRHPRIAALLAQADELHRVVSPCRSPRPPPRIGSSSTAAWPTGWPTPPSRWAPCAATGASRPCCGPAAATSPIASVARPARSSTTRSERACRPADPPVEPGRVRRALQRADPRPGSGGRRAQAERRRKAVDALADTRAGASRQPVMRQARAR